MSIDVTRAELQRAKEQGAAARRAGKPRSGASWGFGGIATGSARAEALNEAWHDGWDAEDAARKAKR